MWLNYVADKDEQVSFNEFRDCMLLLPSTSARAVFDTFRDALYIHHSQSEYSPPLDLAQARVPAQLQGALDVLLSPVSAQLIGYCDQPLLCTGTRPFFTLVKLTPVSRGAIAGAASRSGTAPLSLIVARSQVAASGGGGMVAALKELYAKVACASSSHLWFTLRCACALHLEPCGLAPFNCRMALVASFAGTASTA